MPSKNCCQIYALEGLSPEVRAVTFAKCSRSDKSFKEIAAGLTAENSSKFHEKWVVGYGHSSVAEHAPISIAMENISLLAVEAIESNRLASYTEKSSRYQIYDEDRVYYPSEFKNDKLINKLFHETIKLQFALYKKSIKPVQEIIFQENPKEKEEDQKGYEGRVRSKWIDMCRYLLPNACFANLGMTSNARTYENALIKWFSHPLSEVQNIAKQVKKEALKITPTLVKYADPNSYLIDSYKILPKKVKTILGAEKKYLGKENLVELVDFDLDSENKVLAAVIYQFSNIPYKRAYQKAKNLKKIDREKLLDNILKRIGKHDKPLRALELPYFTFDVLIDQGAYADLKRNRIMTQLAQTVTTKHGYFIPRAFVLAGLEKEYKEVMEETDKAYKMISKKFPNEAGYIATKSFARRFLMKMNLRELYYFCFYRGANPGGHVSYRFVGTKMYEQASKKFPTLMKYLPYIFDQNSKQLNKYFEYIY